MLSICNGTSIVLLSCLQHSDSCQPNNNKNNNSAAEVAHLQDKAGGRSNKKHVLDYVNIDVENNECAV